MWQRFVEAQRRSGMLLVWAVAVGALAGFVGGAFRLAVSAVETALPRLHHLAAAAGLPGWAAPMLSTALLVAAAVWLVRRFAPEAAGSGVQEIEGVLDGVRPLNWRRLLPVKFAAGVLALGSGMVLGREGPTIQLGGAVGRMLNDLLGRAEDHAHTLVAAGAGAGLAAAFNAPLAGVLFVIEEMRPQFHYGVVSVQAVLVACASSDIVVRLLLGDAPAIPLLPYAPPPTAMMWVFLVLGALIGVLGVLFNGALVGLLELMDRVPGGRRWLVGGAVGAGIGLLGWLAPDATGGGYRAIGDAVAGQIATSGLLLICAVRFATTVVSYASGAPGGIFAPMLVLGTLFGLWAGDHAQALLPGLIPAPGVFVVAGMGALFSATVRAPVTGIVLAVELTGNYGLILPVTIACASATIVAHALGGRPIYTTLLERMLQDPGRRDAGARDGNAEDGAPAG